ncbi:probable sodium/metabolite cotransporter BASS4, chloroplastic isoform X2 [Ananas comosus]|uniref:Probable sodium/metabolite cotransporter BASS4, chloroplastic isoform X2 n=1 Tax=Ananas comosus TaxID=4615 RepID=A0A6P5H173_ANACO|nr:probable sodium/metabolite cotransporter BASS4, chloroplastic isoform X2 [Ananas comosus]
MVAVALHALSSKPSYATSHGVLRRTPPPLLGSRFGFSTKFVVPLAPSPLRGEHLPLLRPLMAAGGSDRVYDSGNNQPEASETLKVFEWGRSLLSFVSSNFLPLALVGGIIFGLANPTLGCLAHKYSLSKFSTIGIFFLSGLMLRTAELGAAIEAWPAGLFGLGSILLLTPFFSRIILQIQLVPHEFVTGVAIFCCMPTTLSSGVALTMLARGNSALALAMTVISNLLGIMIVPLSLSMFIGAGAGVSVPTMPLFKSLVNTLLIPLILGKVVRETLKGVAEFADQNRRAFSMISAILLSLVPWIQILSLVSGGRESVYAKKENARAVIVVASQKTLPVMVAVVEQLGGALGESGLLILPCVASHINQIIIDSFLVNWWLQKDQRHNEAKQV